MASHHVPVRLVRSLLLPLVSVIMFGCSPAGHDPIVARIGEKPLFLSEYEKIYLKSSGTREQAAASSLEEREKLLDLIVRYKLKLEDAYSQGMQKRPDVVQEIEQYKGGLAQSFLVERQVVRAGIQQLHQRRQEEIRAAHILLDLSPNASPAESTAAYRGAYEIIDSLKRGADFATLAARLSKDPSAKENGGDLYYATGGDFVPPFEDAAFALRRGEIASHPVRTRYGLHILKLIDRKPSAGEVHGAHIMVRFSSMTLTPEESTATYGKISRILDSLRAGHDFAEIARRNSEDGGSVGRGGDLGWFSRRRWVRPFDDTVFTLQPGQISSIVRTQYGYHIIKCIERRPPKSFEEAKQELESMYQQRRFADDNASFMGKLKAEVRFVRNDSVVALLCSAVDSSKMLRDSAWAPGLTPELGRATIVSLRTGPVSVDSFAVILRNRPDLQSTSLRSAALLPAIDKGAEQLIFTAKADDLSRTNPEFAAVMKEYAEGVLLYQVEQERIWEKIAPTDTVLREYFGANREKFMFPERLRFTEIRFANETVATDARAAFSAGATFAELHTKDSVRMQLPSGFSLRFPAGSAAIGRPLRATLDSMAAQLSDDKDLLVRFSITPDSAQRKKQNAVLAEKRGTAVKGYLLKKTGIAADRISVMVAPFGLDSTLTSRQRGEKNRLVTAFIYGRIRRVISAPEAGIAAPAADERAKRADSLSVGSLSRPFSHQNGWSIVRLEGREAPRRKVFEEAAPEVSTSYQDYESKRLENEWIAGLRKRFPVVEQKEILQGAFAPVR